jgi:hypothetical protein
MVFQQDRLAVVQVRDIETKAAIPDAEILLVNSFETSPLHKANSFAKTGPDGNAQCWLDASTQFGPEAEVSAKSYLPGKINISPEEVRKLKPAGLFEKPERHSPDFVVELYSEPAFSVELVLPDGYRGLIKVEVSYQDDRTCPQGMRNFRYGVSPSGEASLTEPSLLRQILPPSYQASYAHGTKLTSEMGISKVGFRWLKQEDNCHYFVVGNQCEYDCFCRSHGLNDSAIPNQSQNGKQKGGRGGHRHKSDSMSQGES